MPTREDFDAQTINMLTKGMLIRQINAAIRNGDDWAYHKAQSAYHTLTGEFYYEQDRDT